MFAETKIDHFELTISCGRRKQKVLQLQVSVDDSFQVKVPDSAEHLLDQSGAFAFGVMVVWLLVKAVKELTPETEFLYKTRKKVSVSMRHGTL
jgi:hypothetical protein